jgi:hypothetical protein
MPNKDLVNKETKNNNEESNEYLKQTQIIAIASQGESTRLHKQKKKKKKR